MSSSKTLGAALALASGAAAQVTTVRVEIDYMEDGLHSHRPTAAEIDAVVQMFACRGVNLIVDVDDAIPHSAVVACDDPGQDGFFTCSNGPTAFRTIADEHRDQGAGWHYCLFAHVYDDGDGTGSSGIAELPGDDFLVADGVLDGQPQTPYWRAATFAHELGHNLGLEHYGAGSTQDGPFAPNLPSVMNYRFQLTGVATQLECQGLVGPDHLFKDLDYSSGRLRTLNEASLREPYGVGIHPVDWDCDGSIDTAAVAADLNGESDWCASGVGTGVLFDGNEWAALVDVSLLAGAGPVPVQQRVVGCADLATLLAPGHCPQTFPTLESEPCEPGEMVFVSGATFLPGDGTASFPLKHLDTAVASSPAGSVLYLQPGTVTTSDGQGLLIEQPLVLAGPWNALVVP